MLPASPWLKVGGPVPGALCPVCIHPTWFTALHCHPITPFYLRGADYTPAREENYWWRQSALFRRGGRHDPCCATPYPSFVCSVCTPPSHLPRLTMAVCHLGGCRGGGEGGHYLTVPAQGWSAPAAHAAPVFTSPVAGPAPVGCWTEVCHAPCYHLTLAALAAVQRLEVRTRKPLFLQLAGNAAFMQWQGSRWCWDGRASLPRRRTHAGPGVGVSRIGARRPSALNLPSANRRRPLRSVDTLPPP